MDEILQLFRDATGHNYDGDTYNIVDLPDDNGNESDIDISINEFEESDDDSDEGNNDEADLENLDLDLDSGSGRARNQRNPRSSSRTEIEWSDETTDIVVEDFTEFSGPVHDLDETCEPYDYLCLLLPEQFYESVARETNSYAQYRQEQANMTDKVWYSTNTGEIKLFFHINIIMGIHQLPSYELYWSSDDCLCVAAIADVMSKNRYEKLSKYFHLNDSRTQPPREHPDYDPLYKVRPMLDCISQNIATVFKPGQNISIDEAMIAFHGRLAFKQYIKGKPNPWGIKVWCAADAATGYLLNFSIYTGKVNDPLPHGLGHHVVITLGAPYLDKRHHFIFDNYFSSVHLASELLAQRTYCCSTIRTNRVGWPKAFKPVATKKMKTGDILYRQQGNLVATVWKDKRHVAMLSTNASAGMSTVKRRSPRGHVDVNIPTPVAVYNASMGGVDRFDQMCSYYPVGRKSRKWWRYLFRFLLQVAIVNSYLLYSNSHRPKPQAKCLSQLQFRLSLSSSLKKGNISRKRKATAAAPTTAGLGESDRREHRLVRLNGSKRACYWCAKTKNYTSRGRARETVMGCDLCQIRLCKGHCFSVYHESLGV